MSDDQNQGLSLDDVLAAGGPPTPAPAPQPDPAPAPAPTPAPKPLSLDEVLSVDQDRDRLAAATAHGLEQDPARAAKLLALQTRTGLPTDLIDRNYDAVLSAARKADFDPDAFRRQSPMVAQWLAEDPARVGLTRDDLPNLAAVEALVRSSPDYRYRPDGSIVESFPDSHLAAVYGSPRELRDELVRRGIALDDANARQKQAEDSLRRFGPLSGVAAGALLEAGKTLRAGQALTGADSSAIAEGEAQTGAASQAVNPSFLGGDVPRFIGGQLVDLPLMLAGGPLAKLSQEAVKATVIGKTLAPLLGEAGMAVADRAVTGAAAMQPFAIRDALADEHGTGHALGSWALDSGIAAAFGPVGAGRYIAKEAGAKIAPFAATAGGMRVLLDHLGLGGGQMAAFDLAHRAQDAATGVDPTALDWHNLLPGLAKSFALGAMPAAVFGAPEAVARAREIHDRAGMPQINRMAAALHGAETLRSIGDQVNDTQAMKLNQDATRGLLEKLAGDTPYRTLYVDAKAWQQHFDEQQPENPQAKPLSGAREMAASATGDGLAFDKALSSNGHLAIPLDRFVPLLADTAHREWLTGEARLAPEAMNEREAKEAATAATERASIQAEAAGPDSPEAKRAASADLVHADVRSQLMAAGVEESVADRNASLWRSVMHTAAERGWTPDLPHEAYARFKLRIQRGLAQPMVRSAVDALIERLKAGDIPTEADVERAKVRHDGEKERQATEDSARISQIRSTLLDMLEHFRAVGADVQKETTDQLKQRLLAAQADRGEAMAQGEPLEVHGRPVVVADVPYGGGTSSDGRTVYIDRRIPRYLDVNGKRLDVHRMIAEHEVAEKARMDRGESYARAHDAATDVEHDAIDHQGISHAEYERLLKPYLDESKQAAAEAGIPADLEPKPYREMGEEHLIAGRSALAQADPGAAPRGTFLPQRLSAAGESLVTLLKGADRSTFLHETGHALLEFMHDLAARPDAPDAVKADLAKIRDWLGAEGDAPITRAQHEQFARGFERYLMEGKAPSPALRGAFQRFKQWLKDVYRSLADLHVHLSDEVRAVFDRMLASDDEIASAQQETGAGAPVFADQDESGMNDQQWSAYLARVKEGTDRAREILEREAMAPLRAEATKQYQEERAKTRLAVADEVNQRPVYTAMLVLQKGAWPEGVEIPEGAERVKLDKRDLVARLGDAGLKLLPGPAEEGVERPNRGRRIYSDDGHGISADDAAELFGFRDGGDLVQALMSAPDRAAEIERVTDEKMRDVHPDPLLDGTLHERARLAVDNDPRLEAMEREATALAARSNRAATPSELLRAVAKAQIAKTKAMDLRPSLYRVARDRAVRAGAEAMAKARTTADPREKARLQGEALDHKTNEILQTHLYREASSAVERVEKNRQYARSWDKADKRERIGKAGGWEWTVEMPSGQQGQPESFSADAFAGDPAKALAAAQARARQMPGADVVRSGYLEQADAIREGIDLAPATNAAIERREGLREFIARKLAADEPINIPPEVVDALGKRHWREMTVSQQQAVVDALRNLEHLAGVKNKLLAQGWKVTFDVAKAEQVAQMRATGRLRTDRGPSLMDNAVDIAGSYFSGMATVARYAREMDGGRDGGVMFDHWLRSVNEAEGRQLEMKERSTAEVARLVKEWGKLSTVAGSIPLSLRSHEPAIGRSMSHWERLMVALNWGNADNRARLLQGHGWTEAQAERVMAKLDGKDMRFVQGILDHIDSWWPEVKAKQERVFGVAPDKVEATPIVHGSGIYRGGYFPIAYDPRSMSKDITVDQQATLTRQGARLYASTARGHTEARTGMPPDAKLLLDPGVITRHLDNVVHDLAYHETLIDLNRFLRDPEIGATMRAYWGADVYRQFQTRLRDVAAGAQGTSTGIERLLEWTRQGVNFANRAFNIGSALQQAAGLPGSIVRVGPRYFAKALVGMFRNPYGADNAFRWVDEQSPMMRNRSKTFDKNVADAMQGISLRAPARKIIDGAGYYFWTKAFQVLDTHTWLASYMKAMDEQAGDHGKAKAIADQTVADVQGSGATKDLPAAMRGGALAQVFTSNMSWWLANYNLTAEAVNRGARGVRTGNLGDVLKSGSDLFVLYGVQVAAWSALSAALTGQKADQWKNVIDDPGTLAASLAKDAAYTGLSSMVLLRDLADVAIEGRGYRGPAGLRSMSLIAAAVQAIRADQENASEVKAVAKAAGPILHLPVAQIVDTAEGIAHAQEDGRSPLWAAMFGPARK